MRIIDDTYDGSKFPIVERDYNAYYFPDNYNPDNVDQQADGIMDAVEHHWKTRIYRNADPK